MWLLHQWTLVEIELLATVGWNPPGNSHSKMGRTCCFMLSKMVARHTQWIPRGMGWKWGCQPFSCRCSQNVTHCKRRFVGHVSFQESIPTIPFGYSKHPLPARSRFLRAAAHSTSCAFSLHYACKRSHPFVEDSGFVSYAEKHRFGHGVLVSKVCSWVMATYEMCRDWAFSVGWKWGCQPLCCRCWQNVTHCRKETFSTCLSRESI